MSKFQDKNIGVLTNVELKQTKYKILYWVMFALLIMVALISFLPSVWVLLSGFKSVQEIYAIPPSLLPERIDLSKLGYVWNTMNFTQSYVSTFVMTAGNLVAAILVPAIAGYVLSRLQPKGSKLMLAMLLWSMMMPGTIRLVPLFSVFIDMPVLHLNLTNTYWPFIIMSASNIFDTFLFKNYFDSISISYLEAARIDGCGNMRIFFKIVLPLAMPIVMVVAIFTVNNAWSSFLWPLLIFKNEELMPVAVKIFRMKGEYSLDLYMLSLVFAFIPPTIIYICFQKQILGGLAAGGVKG